jgi:hypothetical protein
MDEADRDNSPDDPSIPLTPQQHRERLEVELYQAIKAWLECAPEKRPSPQSLGQRIAEIAAKLQQQGGAR